MNRITNLLVVAVGLMVFEAAAGEKAFPVNDAWVAKVREAAPAAATVKPKKQRRVLMLSLATGYRHWVIPHVERVVQVLGEKSGAYAVDVAKDVSEFNAENLKKYDAVVLNNTCPHGKHRHLYRDVLVEQWAKRGKLYPELSSEDRIKKADELKVALLDYVAQGGGLIGIHGAATTFTKSADFTAMMGGGFESHLKQQMITYLPTEKDHPLTKSVPSEGFSIVDEPYMFNMGYDKLNFRPLLVGDAKTLKDKSTKYRSQARYVAWVRGHEKGRVFYVSPSHNGSAYVMPSMLQFYLDGIQYALGDLDCDDSPIGK